MKKFLTVLLVIAVMFTFSFGSAFATVSWTGEATSKTLNEAGDYALNGEVIVSGTTAQGAEGITEAHRAQLTATAKAELRHAKKAGTFYASEKAAADRKSTRLNSSHNRESRMPSSA